MSVTIGTDGKDGHGLKLEKVGPTLSSFNAMAAKIDHKILGVGSPMQFALYLLHNSKEALLHTSRQTH